MQASVYASTDTAGAARDTRNRVWKREEKGGGGVKDCNVPVRLGTAGDLPVFCLLLLLVMVVGVSVVWLYAWAWFPAPPLPRPFLVLSLAADKHSFLIFCLLLLLYENPRFHPITSPLYLVCLLLL